MSFCTGENGNLFSFPRETGLKFIQPDEKGDVYDLVINTSILKNDVSPIGKVSPKQLKEKPKQICAHASSFTSQSLPGLVKIT